MLDLIRFLDTYVCLDRELGMVSRFPERQSPYRLI